MVHVTAPLGCVHVTTGGAERTVLLAQVVLICVLVKARALMGLVNATLKELVSTVYRAI